MAGQTQLTVKTLKGDVIEILVNDASTVREIKAMPVTINQSCCILQTMAIWILIWVCDPLPP